MWTWVSWYQNVSILDIVGAKSEGGGGDNRSYKTCKAPVKSSLPTNQRLVFVQSGCPSCHPTNIVKALKGKLVRNVDIIPGSSSSSSASAVDSSDSDSLRTHNGSSTGTGNLPLSVRLLRIYTTQTHQTTITGFVHYISSGFP